MIGFLRGHVLMSHDMMNTIGSKISGDCTVGYEVHVSESLGVGAFCELWVHEHAPQDAPHELYGFATIAERDLFRKLLDIKGVGPKVAQRIVASGELLMTAESLPVWDLFNAPARLTKIRGVGATLAQRIVEAMQ